MPEWIQSGKRSYMDLSFDKEMTEEEVYKYAQSQNYWGYHPAGYGPIKLEPLSDDKKGWRWWRWNSCD